MDMARSNGKSLEGALVTRLMEDGKKELVVQLARGEREIVFGFRDKGSTESDVYEIVKDMGNSDYDWKSLPTILDPKRVKVALGQYKAREELEKREEYKRTFKEKIKGMIEDKKRDIEDNYPNLLSVKITKDGRFLGFLGGHCSNCEEDRVTGVYAKIKYLNGKGEIPTPQIDTKFLLKYCRRCGDINEKE